MKLHLFSLFSLALSVPAFAAPPEEPQPPPEKVEPQPSGPDTPKEREAARQRPAKEVVEASETRDPASVKKDPAAIPEEEDRAPLDGRETLRRIHAANQLEVKLGAYAAAHAASPEVRSYAAHLASDHQDIDARVRSLARRKNVSLDAPTPFTDEERTAMEQEEAESKLILTLTGEELDRAYLRTMIAAHDRDIATLRRAAAIISDDAISTLLKRLVPMMLTHRNQAASLSSSSAQPQG